MHEDMFKYLGDCIRSARIDCGLTQQELADQTGRGLRHIQNIEKGKINPSYEVLSALIKRLGISADVLFNPDFSAENIEAKNIISKIMTCTKDEQQIILHTLNCMAEQFILRHHSQPTESIDSE